MRNCWDMAGNIKNFGTHRADCIGKRDKKGEVRVKGNLYLLKYSWKFQKKYILYSILQELLSSLAPFAVIIMPKFIIDELLGKQRIDVILSYVSILVLFLLVMINGFVEGKLKEKYAELDMQKAPVERRTNYLICVIEDFSYGKEIRLLNASGRFAGKVRYYLNISQNFYKSRLTQL